VQQTASRNAHQLFRKVNAIVKDKNNNDIPTESEDYHEFLATNPQYYRGLAGQASPGS
jgi:hypothetical protein